MHEPLVPNPGVWSSLFRCRGAYHFGHPGEDAQAQAKYFVDTVGQLGNGEVMVLDIEVASSNASLHSAQDVASWSKAFVDAVCALANVPPSRVLIYTGAWFW
jgi:lysozyme